MKPKNNSTGPKKEFEKLTPDEWLKSKISDIERDENHPVTFDGQTTNKDCVRIVFEIEGCAYKHKDRWRSFSYHSKSGLFNIFLKELVSGAVENMDFELTALVGMEIKTMWKNVEGKDGSIFQNLVMVRPAGNKISMGTFGKSTKEAPKDIVEDAPLSDESEGEPDLPF